MPRPAKDETYGTRILKIGSAKGYDIWELQVKLIGWGSGTDNDGVGNALDPVRLTAEFDTTTRDAVLRFQKAHVLPMTGQVDATVYRALDREVALHPVVIRDLRCPCATGANDGPILCRCTGMDASTPPKPKDHLEQGKCTEFGKKRFTGKFLLDDSKLADGTALATEKLDVYDMYEYEGMDKAVLWAVRALMHRADLQTHAAVGAVYKPVRPVSGYRCWEDNYHNTDDLRWRHRRSTFHFGKAIEFTVLDHCTEPDWKDDKDECPQCKALREVALSKCGFQLRWQEPGRVTVAEGTKKSRPPAPPFGVQVDTVRLHERKGDNALDYTDHFVKTDADAAKPLFPGNLIGVNFPVVLDTAIADAVGPLTPAVALKVDRAIDPKFTPGQEYFRNTETAAGGQFPIGSSRIWHGGVHVYAAAGRPVRAIADGEIVGCRAGEADAQANGSRNFVVVRHVIKAEGAWKDKEFYCLYMHLDGGEIKADAPVRWRRELFVRSKAHFTAIIPSPLFELRTIDTKKKWVGKPGLGVDESREVDGAEARAYTLDDKGMPNDDTFKVVPVAGLADHYFFTKRENIEMGKRNDAVAGIENAKVIGLQKPIRVYAGEVLGTVAPAATEEPAKALGAFLHLETFAEGKLPVTGFVDVDGIDAAKVADRKEVVAALVKVKLIPEQVDGVLLDAELRDIYARPPYHTRLRSAAVQMPSAWSVDWKAALKAPPSMGFLKNPDAMGDAWNKSTWWEGVKAGNGKLPADATKVWHYHPISLILQLAYS